MCNCFFFCLCAIFKRNNTSTRYFCCAVMAGNKFCLCVLHSCYRHFGFSGKSSLLSYEIKLSDNDGNKLSCQVDQRHCRHSCSWSNNCSNREMYWAGFGPLPTTVHSFKSNSISGGTMHIEKSKVFLVNNTFDISDAWHLMEKSAFA